MGMKTRKARLRRALEALGEFCRRHRHDPLKEQHAALTRRMQGHLNYFGVNGNIRALSCLVAQAEATWRKWLNRRSQRKRLTWERFRDLLKVFPLPVPHIRVRIWGPDAMRLLSGRAVWRKSPRTDPRGLRAGNCPELPDHGTGC
jgi:hypothetical protein